MLAASQTGRATTDDGYRGLVDLGLASSAGLSLGHVVLGNLAHLFHTVNAGDADAAHLSVDEHFAGTALADAALQAAVAARGAVAVHNKSCLMKGGGYGFTLLSAYGSPLELELHEFFFWKVKNRMIFNFIHDNWLIWLLFGLMVIKCCARGFT